ncbi:MAG TPA: flagellar protein FlgN [Spirochaetota bacterium]
MESPVLELERILHAEIELYDKIASLEEGKTDAILSRDGAEIETCSKEQEKFLSAIATLEVKREESIEKYRTMNHLDEVQTVSIHQLVLNMDEDSALRLSRCGLELKKTMLRIKSLSDTNMKLISDNLEFFNILLSGLRSSASFHNGYTRDGERTQKLKGALLINKTV